MTVAHLEYKPAPGGNLVVSDVASFDRAAVERNAADIDVLIGLTAGLDSQFFAVFE